MKILHTITIVLCLSVFMNISADSLSISDIESKVNEHNKALKSADLNTEIAIENIEQTKKFPNPELEIELENLGKNEIGIGLGYPLELGGKRKNRIQISELEKEMIILEKEILELELNAEITSKVLPILAQQETITILNSFIKDAEKILELIEKRVEIGAAQSVEKIRAELELEELKLERTLTINEFMQLKSELATLWQGSGKFCSLRGSLNENFELPEFPLLIENLTNHPENKMQSLERKLAKLELSAVKKSTIPDISLGAGIVRNNEEKENAFVLSAGLELPIFNRNKNEIKATKIGTQVLENEITTANFDREAEIRSLYNEFVSLDAERKTMEEKVLPSLTLLFETLKHYYESGSVSLLELTETQSELLEMKTNLMEIKYSQAELCNEIYKLSNHKISIIQSK